MHVSPRQELLFRVVMKKAEEGDLFFTPSLEEAIFWSALGYTIIELENRKFFRTFNHRNFVNLNLIINL